LLAGLSRIFAQEGFGQLLGEQPFAHAGRPAEQEGVGQPTALGHAAEAFDQVLVPLNACPGHYKTLATSRRMFS
jgi:hypothetical protein